MRRSLIGRYVQFYSASSFAIASTGRLRGLHCSALRYLDLVDDIARIVPYTFHLG